MGYSTPAAGAAGRRAGAPSPGACPEQAAAHAGAWGARPRYHDEDVGGRLSFKVINPKFLLKYDE